jgi:hypothetical protein
MNSFGLLFRLNVLHDYLGGAQVPIRIEPDTATAKLTHAADLRMKVQYGRADILCVDDRTDLADFAEDGALTFVFRLLAEDPALIGITDTLADSRNSLFVLDSGLRAPGPLHDTQTLAADDLRSLKPDDLITAADVLRPPLAIVRMRVAIDSSDAVYSVRFGASARYWTYHVMGGAPDSNFTIHDTVGDIGFNLLGPRAMADGRLATSFRSSDPIAYRARPGPRFELLGDGPFGPRVVLPVLPAAGPGSARLDPDGPGPGADIYVYVT